jgi:hypothetical protein
MRDQIVTFWAVTPCTVVSEYQRFGWAKFIFRVKELAWGWGHNSQPGWKGMGVQRTEGGRDGKSCPDQWQNEQTIHWLWHIVHMSYRPVVMLHWLCVHASPSDIHEDTCMCLTCWSARKQKSCTNCQHSCRLWRQVSLQRLKLCGSGPRATIIMWI